MQRKAEFLKIMVLNIVIKEYHMTYIITGTRCRATRKQGEVEGVSENIGT